MGANIVSEARKAQARKHASKQHRCFCGKICLGNGGWSSHKKSCGVYQNAKRVKDQQAENAIPPQQVSAWDVFVNAERLGSVNATSRGLAQWDALWRFQIPADIEIVVIRRQCGHAA